MTVTEQDRERAREVLNVFGPTTDVRASRIELIAAALADERERAFTEARWAVNARRFDKSRGEAAGPDNFYNGCRTAERVIARLSQTGVSLGPVEAEVGQ